MIILNHVRNHLNTSNFLFEIYCNDLIIQLIRIQYDLVFATSIPKSSASEIAFSFCTTNGQLDLPAHVGLLGPAAGVNKVVGRKQNLSDEDLNKTRNGVGLTEVMKT